VGAGLVIDPALSMEPEKPAKASPLSSPEPLNYLTGDPTEVAKAVLKDWSDQNRLYKRRVQQWRVNRARHANIPGVFLIKRTDTQEWVAWFPPGTQRQVPALNKAARVARVVRALMFVDPPVLEAVPAGDNDEARDAAEFATRALTDICSESQLDDTHKAAEAFDLASIYDSGYRRYYLEPNGEQRPMEVKAHPAATAINPQDPASSLVDPGTGLPSPGPFVTQYVRQDYTLANTAEDPQLIQVNMEALRSEVLKASQVRFLPATAKDIWDAEGVVIGAYRPLGEVRRCYPKGVPLEPDKLAEMCRYYPEETDDLVPGGKPTRDALTSKEPDESTLVWTVTTYWEAGGRFPKGFYAVAAGEGVLLARDIWYDSRNNKRLDIPVDQLRQFADPDNAHGSGFFSILGAGNEIRNAQIGGMLEHQDRFLNRKIFYPVNSSLQAKSQQALTGTYVPISPGGQPTAETVPDFPSAIMDMFNLISSEMDSESGVQPPATGQNPPSVQSAIHARTIIEQVNVGLSELRTNVIRCS
jgi:hypothetical protein